MTSEDHALRRLWMYVDRTTGLLTVDCPRRGEIPVELCSTCEHGDSFHLDPQLETSYVRCAWMPNEPRPALEAPLDWDALGDHPVREVMTEPVVRIGPRAPVSEIRALFEAQQISGVPVIDENDRPVGVVSKIDLAGAAPELTAEDLMIPLPFSVRPDAPISQAAALMAYEGVHRLPVVAEDGTVTGMITTLDIVRWLASRSLPS